MFRTKIAASLFLVFAAAGAVVYINVADDVESRTQARVEEKLQVARRNIERSRRLNDYAVVAKAQQVAAWPQMADVLARPIEQFADQEGNPPPADEYRYQIHRLMNEEVMVWRAKFEALASGKAKPNNGLAEWRTEAPDLFVVVDPEGIGVSKAGDPAWYGPRDADLAAKHPAIRQALEQGQTIKDLWMVTGAPMTVAVAPVRSGGRVVGAVVLGYRLTDAEAKRDKALVNTDIAYFLGDRLSQSSTLDAATERAVQQKLASDKLYEKLEERSAIELELNGRPHLAYVGGLGGNETAATAGFMVIADLGAALAEARSVLFVIPLACGLGFLLAVGLAFFFYERQMAPFEEIDQGIMEIIQGNREYWFDVKGKQLPGTMSQNLNIMVCELTGRPLPEEIEEQMRHQDPAEAGAAL